MVLLRVIHAAELPDPASLIARLQSGATVAIGAAAASAPASAAVAASASPPPPPSFTGLVEALERDGKALLALKLRDQVGLVRFAPGELVLRPLQPLGTDFPRDLAAALKGATGSSWSVSLSDEEAEPSLKQQEDMAEERARAAVLADPAVAAILHAIPGATLQSVSAKEV